MKTAWKILLGIGISFFVIGIVLIIVGFATNGWSAYDSYEMHTYTQQDDICTDLHLELSAGEMNVEFYSGDKIVIEYPSSVSRGYNVTESRGKITLSPKGGLIFNFGWNKMPAINVKLPDAHSKTVNLELDVSAGKVDFGYGVFKSVKLDISAGDVNMGNIKCDKFDADVSAGSVSVDALESQYGVEVDISAGDIDLNYITTNKITAHVSAGSAEFRIVGSKSDYDVSVSKSAGSCNLSNQRGTSPDKSIDVNISAGSANFSFVNA